VSVFSKIARGVLIGGGTILSLFAPAIGAPLMVAGANINVDKNGTTDKLGIYANNLTTAQNMAQGMAIGGQITSMPLLERIKQNPLPWLAGLLVGLLVLPKLLKKIF
jgi:hypothetical protein